MRWPIHWCFPQEPCEGKEVPIAPSYLFLVGGVCLILLLLHLHGLCLHLGQALLGLLQFLLWVPGGNSKWPTMITIFLTLKCSDCLLQKGLHVCISFVLPSWVCTRLFGGGEGGIESRWQKYIYSISETQIDAVWICAHLTGLIT